jgi:hypothetical protein
MSYYVPEIEEFVEGFKYQTPHTGRLDILNMSDKTTQKGKTVTTWFDRVVPNLDPITYPHTYTDSEGISWTFLNPDPLEENYTDRIKRMLELNQIRCKK